MRTIDLDVSTPDQVADVLREAADAYRESQSELQSAWQDSQAGKEWQYIAAILERAASSIDKRLAKMS